jgi:hypothetical protein
MTVQVCSLITTAAQIIPADGEYHILKFPFDAAESYDAHSMHRSTSRRRHRLVFR